jgi:pilus assembly protein Flp/PilA
LTALLARTPTANNGSHRTIRAGTKIATRKPLFCELNLRQMVRGSIQANLSDQIQAAFRFEGHIGPIESGATAIEYGLIAAGISLAIIAVVNGIGVKLNTRFSSINSSLK